MDELRCPMCGKPNPKEQDVCQYCQARLRPVWDSNDGAPASPPDDPQQDPGASLPDWLSSLRSQSDEEATTPDEPLPEEPEESLPDWLRAGDEPEQAAQNTNIPSWLENAGSAEENPPSNEDEIPDWLQNLRNANDEAPEPAVDETESDWLAGMRSSREVEDKDSWHLPEDEDSSTPGFFGASAFSYDEEDRKQDEGAPGDGFAGNEIPGWLAIPPEPDADPARSELSEEVEEGEEAPGEPGPESAAEPEQSAESTPAAPTPAGLNWLDRFSDQAISNASLLADNPPLGESPDAENDNGLDEVDLSWLDALEAAAPELDIEEPFALSDPAADVAPFLQGNEAESGESLLTSELPDWLAPASADHEDAGEADQSHQEDAGLVQADLPNWLEAMRPVGNELAPEETGVEAGAIEGVGPLSGLRGVLPAEAGISPVTKPPAYSNKLQVTEAQQAHVDTLKELLQGEGQPRPLPRRSVLSSQHVLRIAIFAVLLVVVSLPLFAGFPLAAAPAPQLETSEIFEQVDRLPPAAPVLLVVDYQPGLSGEMDAALSPLVDHLMLKGTYLAAVSTSATGPLQAERLLKMVNDSGSHAYRTIDQYANLGYIPGGAVGLQAFAQNPRQVTRFANNATVQSPDLSAWQAAPMQELNALDDFSMIVVASDDPDTVRTWVEQVEPYLVDAPLVAVVSAQAEPLVRPYYQSRQVDGLLAGLSGGVSYAGATGRLAAARTYWPSFSLALLVAALLIVVGGSLNAISGLAAKRRENAKGRA